MNTYATWNDGHTVSIPGKVLAELEVAWRQADRWHVVEHHGDAAANSPDILDAIEDYLIERASMQAAKSQRSILTHSGPKWSLQPWRHGTIPERDKQADYCPWTRGTPLPEGGAWWLVCRMSGLSIPLLPHEEKP